MGQEPKKRKNQRLRRAKFDHRLAQALNHPARVEILAVLNERCASPSELSEVLDYDLSAISYHTRELLRLECIEVVGRERVRGAVKTQYRATKRMLLDNDHWNRLNKETRAGITMAAVGETIERAAQAIESGTFDERLDRVLLNLKMDLDEEGWEAVTEILRDAWGRIEDVEEEATNRIAERAGSDASPPPFRMTISLLGYESPSGT